MIQQSEWKIQPIKDLVFLQIRKIKRGERILKEPFLFCISGKHYNNEELINSNLNTTYLPKLSPEQLEQYLELSDAFSPRSFGGIARTNVFDYNNDACVHSCQES